MQARCSRWPSIDGSCWERRHPPGIYFRFKRAELVFALITAVWLLGGFLALQFALLEARSIGSPWLVLAGMVLGVVIYLWLMARLCLIFPHAAVTGQFAPFLSWRAMRGNFGSWLIIFLLIAFVLIFLQLLLALPFVHLQAFGVGSLFDPAEEAALLRPSDPLVFLHLAASTILWGYGEAVNIAALSYIYRAAVQEKAPAPSGPETDGDSTNSS